MWASDYKKFNDWYRQEALKELTSVISPIREAQLKKLTPKVVERLLKLSPKAQKEQLYRLFSIPQASNIEWITKNFPVDEDKIKLVVNNNRLDRSLTRAVNSQRNNELIANSIDDTVKVFQNTIITANNRRINSVYNKIINKYGKIADINNVIDDIAKTVNISNDYDLLANTKNNNIQSVEKTIGRDIEEDDFWLYDGPSTSRGTKTGVIRRFCNDRAKGIYTTKDINSWESLSWDGKIYGSSVWDVAGGYNCRHWIVAYIEDEEDLRTVEPHTDKQYKEYSNFIASIEIDP